MSKSIATIIKGSGDIEQMKSLDQFNVIINQEPQVDWLEDHPLAKGVKYLPIDKVELMLTEIFQQWHIEVLREGQMLNAIYTTIRLHYKHPITLEWTFQDGVGAAPIQTDKGFSASDLAHIKNDAILKALPASKSFAIKDAADHIGKIFGRDLNRKATMNFTPAYDDSKEVAIQEAIDKINACQTLDDLKSTWESLGVMVKQPKVMTAKDVRKIELQKELA